MSVSAFLNAMGATALNHCSATLLHVIWLHMCHMTPHTKKPGHYSEQCWCSVAVSVRCRLVPVGHSKQVPLHLHKIKCICRCFISQCMLVYASVSYPVRGITLTTVDRSTPSAAVTACKLFYTPSAEGRAHTGCMVYEADNEHYSCWSRLNDGQYCPHKVYTTSQ